LGSHYLCACFHNEFWLFLCAKKFTDIIGAILARVLAAVLEQCNSCGAFGGAVWFFVRRSFKEAARATNCVGLLDDYDSDTRTDPDPLCLSEGADKFLGFVSVISI